MYHYILHQKSLASSVNGGISMFIVCTSVTLYILLLTLLLGIFNPKPVLPFNSIFYIHFSYTRSSHITIYYIIHLNFSSISLYRFDIICLQNIHIDLTSISFYLLLKPLKTLLYYFSYINFSSYFM